MTRTKSTRYTAAQDEPMIIQSGKEFFTSCKGKWREEYFKNNNPIVLELACGRGEYTVGLSQMYPERNFIGVDIKGERMMMGLKEWQENTWKDYPDTNVAFLRTIIHHIDQFFEQGEVDEIWIIHPDPRSKGHDERRRITSPRFLLMYEKILKTEWLLRLRTDDDGMFEYSTEQLKNHGFDSLESTRDLDNSSLAVDHHNIETHYGKLFKAEGRTIKYGLWKKH